MAVVKRILALVLLALLPSLVLSKVQGEILIGRNAGPLETYAAKELQRYLYQLSGSLLEINENSRAVRKPSFVIGRTASNPIIKKLLAEGKIRLSPAEPGLEGYVLKSTIVDENPVVAIAANDAIGCLYGVYGLLADYYHVGFFLGGDILPDKKSSLAWVDVDEAKTPAVSIRGFLPWTNFPQSATVYSWEDWKFIIDQMAKMRLNFIHIHNYNGELGHNEMYHNFVLNGFTSRVWMPTARTGHKWGCPGWDVNHYLFGAADLFDDYDFGADCALHNENLSSEEVFRKSASLFQRVIAYAHARGVKVGLGLDIDLIPPEYKAKPDDPGVIAARVDQLATDYPGLDYLLCFQSENIGKNPDFYQVWRKIFMGFYDGTRSRMPGTRLAVSGWGLDPQSIATLPQDVICAPIAAYSDRCETGAIYGDREYWGCPWLERDFNSSEYYYPYNLHLSNTIAAFRDRAPNMKGFTCLTWRLTDAIDAKISYISRAPWDAKGVYRDSRAVYAEYATLAYGTEPAGEITDIIDQNEPLGSDFGECQATPPFAKDRGRFLLDLSRFVFTGGDSAVKVSRVASEFSSDSGVTKCPIVEGGECVGYVNGGDWVGYSGVNFGTGVVMFQARVATATEGGEISIRLDSLDGPEIGRCVVGNTGGWQQWVTQKAAVVPTSSVHDLYLRFMLPKETSDDYEKAVGQLAVIDRWISRTLSPAGRARLHLLRCRIAAAKDHIELNSKFAEYPAPARTRLVASWVRNFTHRVTDISSLGNVMSIQNRFVQQDYLPSIKGLSPSEGWREEDGSPGLFAVLISPPTSVAPGQSVDLKVRLLEAKSYRSASARIHYRTPGETGWKVRDMSRRTKAIFALRIPAKEVSPDGLEYYVEASDGESTTWYPASGADIPLTVVVHAGERSARSEWSGNVLTDGRELTWSNAGKSAFWYKIYRSTVPSFVPGPATFLTYVASGTTKFRDNGEGWDGVQLRGAWYYRVTAVNREGSESAPSAAVRVTYEEGMK
jgi:hypothetical protein